MDMPRSFMPDRGTCDECHCTIDARNPRIPWVYLPKTQRLYCGVCFEHFRRQALDYLVRHKRMTKAQATQALAALPPVRSAA